MSRASDIAADIAARLAKIDITRGYSTDIGTRVYRGRRKLDESHIPCAVIVEGDDSVTEQQMLKASLAQRYILEGHSECDADNPNDIALGIISDLKRVVFDGVQLIHCKRDVKYIGRIVSPREDGLNIVSAAIEIEVVFVEDLAAP